MNVTETSVNGHYIGQSCWVVTKQGKVSRGIVEEISLDDRGWHYHVRHNTSRAVSRYSLNSNSIYWNEYEAMCHMF